jgi:hypothetical protein
MRDLKFVGATILCCGGCPIARKTIHIVIRNRSGTRCYVDGNIVGPGATVVLPSAVPHRAIRAGNPVAVAGVIVRRDARCGEGQRNDRSRRERRSAPVGPLPASHAASIPPVGGYQAWGQIPAPCALNLDPPNL